MDVRIKIAAAPTTVNVSEFCRSVGIHRDTFYVWKARFAEEGPDGLKSRSRAPRSNRRRVPSAVEDLVVRLRKELAELGVDNGPATIQWHLGRRGDLERVPSQSTIWRILVRRGFVVPEPRKRPHRSWKRFEATAPNELWQADCIDWPIATGVIKVLSFIDDHSRVALRVRALESATTEATWDTFSEASEQWGVPVGQLTDNGLNFSGRLRGFEVGFEIELRRIGVVAKTSRPFHPQTCGKVERFQQTLKKWLRARPLAADLAELQAQLDEFVAYYNHQRPHRGIGRVTPIERWQATPPAVNLGVALPSPARHLTVTVDGNGVLMARPWRVGVGKQWRGHTARVHLDDTHLAVFIDHQLVRLVELDHTRTYQGLTGRTNKRRRD